MNGSIGFIGLGRMGEPMAANLLAAGARLAVCNRSAPALDRIVGLGGEACATAREVIVHCPVTILMLANGEVVRQLLALDDAEAAHLAGRTLVNMGTIAPSLSRLIADRVAIAGGSYVEAPVSGSRGPAEQGTLVGLLAGAPEAVETARAIIAPLCCRTFTCGPIPNALSVKLAVNLYLITMVTGLAEAAHLATNLGIDLDLFRAVLDAGPMASLVSKGKLEKLTAADLSPQASLRDVLMNAALVRDAARQHAIASPLLDQSFQLLSEAVADGLGGLDMIAVTGALEQHTSARRAGAALRATEAASRNCLA